MIIWWEEKQDQHGQVSSLRLSMLIQQTPGFSQRLRQLVHRELPTLIGGPYGERHDLGDFGTCLMFATGIGVASVLPHVKALVHGYRRFEVRTRRIVLAWQVDHESKTGQVRR